MRIVALALLFVALAVAEEWNCQTVDKGDHYAGFALPRYHKQEKLQVDVIMDKSTTNYMFPPNEEQGRRCSVSWNKLFGASRCGYFNHHHKDSDRFVFRRAPDCFIFEGKRVVGVKPDCPHANLTQIAAYAYDDWKKPFQHIGTLEKPFEHYLVPGETYTLEIVFHRTQSVYNLYDRRSGALLETKDIAHRDCGSKRYRQGYLLGLYFGGVCPAPQDVTVCYNNLRK